MSNHDLYISKNSLLKIPSRNPQDINKYSLDVSLLKCYGTKITT